MQDHHNARASNTVYHRPITNRPGQFAVFCREGEARLRELGVGAIYMSMDGARKYGYVTWTDMTAPGEAATLARALANAPKGQCVRYRDGDVTNLRLSNLYLTRGAAKSSSPRPFEFDGAST